MMKRIFFICIFALWISFLFFFERHTVIITPDTTHTGIVTTGSSISIGSSSVVNILADTEVRNTLSRIERDRPKYHQDGAIFMNRERLLPKKSDASYYHEWTVMTPGSEDRGTRRIIEGNSGELYFTDDHYQSFVQLK